MARCLPCHRTHIQTLLDIKIKVIFSTWNETKSIQRIITTIQLNTTTYNATMAAGVVVVLYAHVLYTILETIRDSDFFPKPTIYNNDY